MKTADLVAGPQTDALVALAQGWEYVPTKGSPHYGRWFKDDKYITSEPWYSPSTTRAQWAELIEVFGIWLSDDGHSKIASICPHMNDSIQSGATVALAICKAVIAAKWGDEIPDEIWEKVK